MGMTTTIKRSKGFSLIELLIVIAIIGVLSAMVYGVINESNRPDITNKKDDWSCMKYESRTRLLPTGKSLVPITEDVCIEYKRIDG
jgi:prepilin-type N-terminal cleavage/methylation domain-containing protein